MQDSGRRDIGLRMTVVARMMRKDFDRIVAGNGITRSQWSVVVVVSRMPGATQRRIAEILDMSEASAGRLIDRLCVDGLLKREERAEDRRARAVYITEKAEPILDHLAKVATENEARAFANFTAEELDMLGALIDKLYGTLSKNGES